MKRIRKISIGLNPLDCLVYVVGQKHLGGKIEITYIIKEQRKDIEKYYVYAISDDNNSPFIWQEIINQPVLVQYFLGGAQ